MSKLKISKHFPYHILAFCIMMIFHGCNDEDKNSLSHFDKNIDYTALEVTDRFAFDEIFHPSWTGFRAINGKIFVPEVAGDEVSVHILNIVEEDGSLIYEKGIGRRGQGPGEFLEINDIIATDSLIYIYDGNLRRLVSYDSDSGELAQTNDVHLRKSGRAVNIHSVNDEKFVGIGLFFGKRFIIMDSSGETVGEYGKLLEFNSNFSGSDLDISWFSFGVVKPDEPFIYIFSWNADFIEKYDGNGQLIKRVQGVQKPVPDMELRNDYPFNAGTLSYISVDTDENYIYGLYSGLSREDHGLSGNIIHKFDWDLNLIEAYKLDQRFNQITVDGNGNLYTFGETDEGIEFYVYKLF